jgi:putative two-component system response regulator
MRVLIVDDEAAIRRLLRAWVSEQGADAMEAANAEQAIALVRIEGPPAVALCDLRLPGHDGFWLAEQFRAAHPETVVVMTTAVHEFDAAVQSLRAGAVDYLSKPYARERFTRALQHALLVHESRRKLTGIQSELDERRAQVSDALTEIELNATSALEAMLAMLNARDAASHNHAHRVAKLAVDLAMAMGIGEPQLSDIERAALLHDLGRLAMPDDLLARSSSALSDADRARLHTYPLHGYDMLRNVPFLATANQIAVASHERCDGTGFPHGLTARHLPIGARIVGLADAYDELVSGLHDAPVISPRALEILSIDGGAAFDPDVLGALRALQPGVNASRVTSSPGA